MFLTPLRLEALSAPGKWKVISPLKWHDDIFNDLEVPVDTETDLASLPALLQILSSWFDRNGQSRRPAVVHDWLYSTHKLSRADADKFLCVSLIAEDVPVIVAFAYYAGVRLFGASHWN